MWKDRLTTVFNSAQYEAMRSFYKNTLRLPARTGDGFTLFRAGRTGAVRLEDRPPAPGYFPTAQWLEAGWVDRVWREIREKPDARALVELTDTYYGAREFQVLDPDGNITCIINYQKDLPKRAGPAEGPRYGDEFRAVLYVKNLAACRRFYCEALEMRSVYEWEENRGDRGFKYELCPGSHSFVETLFREPLAPLRQGILELVAVDVAACYERLCQKPGLLFPRRPAGPGDSFVLADPDGNLVRVTGACAF